MSETARNGGGAPSDAGCSSASSGSARLGVLLGAEAQDWLERDGRAAHRQGRHRARRRSCRSAGSASTRSPATSRQRSRDEYRLQGRRASSTSRSPSRTPTSPPWSPRRSPATSSASPAGACTTSRGRACGSRDVLDRAGVQPEAHGGALHVVRRRVHREPHAGAGAPRRRARRVRARRRSPLSDEHGGPVRLYVAPMYGYKSLKWLDTIELTEARRAGLLGDARLRRRRLGRPVERPRRRCHLTPTRTRPSPSNIAVDRPPPTTLVRFDRVERIAPLGERHALRHRSCSPAPRSTPGRSPRSSDTASSCAPSTSTAGLAAPGRAPRRARRPSRHAPAPRPRPPQPLEPRRRALVPPAARDPTCGSASSTPGRSSTPRSSSARGRRDARRPVRSCTGSSAFPLDWRTGATFVHDWFALGIWVAVLGHIFFALRDQRLARSHARRRDLRQVGAHARTALVRGAHPMIPNADVERALPRARRPRPDPEHQRRSRARGRRARERRGNGRGAHGANRVSSPFA